jgi:hypothetical protein
MADPLNLPALLLEVPEAYALYTAGRIDGRAEGLADGYAQGWADAEESMARLHRAAYRLVQTMASLPEVERDPTARARAAARWSA